MHLSDVDHARRNHQNRHFVILRNEHRRAVCSALSGGRHSGIKVGSCRDSVYVSRRTIPRGHRQSQADPTTPGQRRHRQVKRPDRDSDREP